MVDKATGIDETVTASSNQVFPNPVKNELFIQTSGTTNNPHIKLFSIQGKEIQIDAVQVSATKWAVNTSHLQQGQYIVSFLDNKQVRQSKVIVKVK